MNVMAAIKNAGQSMSLTLYFDRHQFADNKEFFDDEKRHSLNQTPVKFHEWHTFWE